MWPMPTLTIHIVVICWEYGILSQFIVRGIYDRKLTTHNRLNDLLCNKRSNGEKCMKSSISSGSVHILKGKCHHLTIKITSQKYVWKPTASCCESTTRIQYIGQEILCKWWQNHPIQEKTVSSIWIRGPHSSAKLRSVSWQFVTDVSVPSSRVKMSWTSSGCAKSQKREDLSYKAAKA